VTLLSGNADGTGTVAVLRINLAPAAPAAPAAQAPAALQVPAAREAPAAPAQARAPSGSGTPYTGDPQAGSGTGSACTTIAGYYPGGLAGHTDSTGFCVPDK
jgi:hypothetical protein